jgi:hypothetical protein
MSEESRNPQPLMAGAAQVDITPKAGAHLAGAVGLHRPARTIADPLHAKALVFESGGKRVCIVTLDVTIVTEKYTEMIRQAAAERLGFDPGSVMVHATQTHSAPPLGHFMVDEDFTGIPKESEWVKGGDDEYAAWAVERAVRAIGIALAVLKPVEIGVGSGIEGRMAFNRRAVMRDGTVGMPGPQWAGPLGPTWIRYIEGPIDPEVGVMCVRTADLRMPAVLVNYACHPVHWFPKPVVSADWPGALSAEIMAAHGRGCVPIVVNGACGNINPWPPFDPDYSSDCGANCKRMGRTLAAMAEKVIETLEFTGEAEVDFRLRNVGIPLRELRSEELDRAQAILEESPEPKWADEARTTVDPEWMEAASVYSVHLMRQRNDRLAYEIQVLRIGDTAIVGLPGEPFVELQLAIKMASPAAFTYVAHCTTHYVGYVPTREALGRGGHEATTRFWAKLVPEAADTIVKAATDMLKDVFGK